MSELEALENLDDDKRAVLAAEIVAGRNFNDIAEDLGVHRSTVGRWRQDPAVIAAVSRARTEVLAGVVGALTTTALDSVRTLEEVRDDPEASNGDRIRAAVALLTEGRHALTLLDHDSRLADLEAIAEQIANNQKALTP